MEQPTKKSKLKLVSILLVVVGLILVIISGIVVFKNYPTGLVELEDLPEPGLIPLATDTALGSSGLISTLEPVGTIKIPSIQISENILEGAGNELLYGVGHIPGTVDPGQVGNCALAGHRNYIQMHPFRFMDKMSVGDVVYVSDDENQYTYEVYEILVVNAEDGWVLEEQVEGEATLTLVTCTPVLNPVNRLIAWGRLTETRPLKK